MIFPRRSRRWIGGLAAGLSSVLLPAALSGPAQVFVAAETSASSPGAARILGEVADGTPPPPAPERRAATEKLRVLETAVRRQGGRTVTIHRVEPPAPESRRPEPAPPPALSDPETQARTAALQAGSAARTVPTDLVPLSVTVYNHKFSFIRWTRRNGEDEPVGYAAWSNIDFNHLCGVGEIEIGAGDGRRRFALLMGVGNCDTARLRELAARRGAPPAEDPLATLPALPRDRPAFALVEGDPSDAGAMALVQGLHDIYAREKDRLAAACEGRQRAREEREEREACLGAHPPKPEDIVLHFSCGRVEAQPADQPEEKGDAR